MYEPEGNLPLLHADRPISKHWVWVAALPRCLALWGLDVDPSQHGASPEPSTDIIYRVLIPIIINGLVEGWVWIIDTQL